MSQVAEVLATWWPKYWSFSFNISPSSEQSGLISFRMKWLDLLAVQGTLKSLLQHHVQKYIVGPYLLSMCMSQAKLNTYVIPLNSSKIGVAILIFLDEVIKVQSSGGAGKWRSWVLI